MGTVTIFFFFGILAALNTVNNLSLVSWLRWTLLKFSSVYWLRWTLLKFLSSVYWLRWTLLTIFFLFGILSALNTVKKIYSLFWLRWTLLTIFCRYLDCTVHDTVKQNFTFKNYFQQINIMLESYIKR